MKHGMSSKVRQVDLASCMRRTADEARPCRTETGFNSFQADTTKLAEMEFYLIEELDFHLIVFQPYRSLVQLTSPPPGGGEPLIKLDEPVFQMAWCVSASAISYKLVLTLVAMHAQVHHQ